MEKAEKLARPSVPVMDEMLGIAAPCLDHGFVRVVDYMGDEPAVVQAARVSYGKGTKAAKKDRGLLRYLMRHRHTTPFEMCEIKLHVKLPVFVARQWIRHRTASVNEYSARYSILAREFYVPEVGDIAKQSTTNKQGRADGTDDMRPEEAQQIIQASANESFNVYDALVTDDEPDDYGVARELARIVTPVSTYTEWYWKVNLHNLLHFLSLRADPHAQKEIRVYAEVICRVVEAWTPNVWEAFVDYRLEAHTFSRQEMAVLRKIVQPDFGGFVEEDLLSGLTDRELSDFKKRLGL